MESNIESLFWLVKEVESNRTNLEKKINFTDQAIQKL